MKAINWRDILWLMFARDWHWKALSLLIACMIYFSIRAQISHLQTFSVPVDVEFDAAGTGIVIESVEPRAVQVTLRGSRSDLNQQSLKTMTFDIRPQRRKKNVAPEDSEIIGLSRFRLRNAGALRTVKIDPDHVLVKFDVPMSLQLDIAKPEITGAARGQVKLVYDQTNAVVTGSRRLLAALTPDKVQVLPAPIDVEGRTQSFQTRVTLLPPGDATRLKVTPPEMVVNVQITNEKATSRITRVPVQILPAAENTRWACAPPLVDLEVTGRAEEVADLHAEDFSVTVNTAPLDRNAPTNQAAPLTVLVRQGTAVTATAVPATVELTPAPEPNAPDTD